MQAWLLQEPIDDGFLLVFGHSCDARVVEVRRNGIVISGQGHCWQAAINDLAPKLGPKHRGSKYLLNDLNGKARYYRRALPKRLRQIASQTRWRDIL